MPRLSQFTPEIGAIFQDAAENIRFAKLQQWRVTNYALLTYAAAYLLRGEELLKTCGGKIALTLIVAVAWAFSSFVLWRLEHSMEKFRDRIAWVYERSFTPKEQLQLTMRRKPFWFDPSIFAGLLVATSLGAILVLAILWH
ncbi:MAG: hypothetical protein ACRECF_01745 [Methyloceanibacter sp.]